MRCQSRSRAARRHRRTTTITILFAFLTFAFVVLRSALHNLSPNRLSLLPTPTICSPMNAPPLLIVEVHSSLANFHLRNEIRKTWLNVSASVPLKHYFVVGRSKFGQDTRIQHRVEREAMRFGDVLQGDFIDSYRNLTRKSLASLRFLHEQCNAAVRFVMKCDDDVFVDVARVVELLRGVEEKQKTTYYCTVLRRNRIIRRKSSNWYVDEKTMAGEFYPPYCRGMAYTMTFDLVGPLLDAAQKRCPSDVGCLPNQDAFISGVLREDVGGSLEPWNEHYQIWTNFGSTCLNPRNLPAPPELGVPLSGVHPATIVDELLQCFNRTRPLILLLERRLMELLRPLSLTSAGGK